MFKAFDKWLIPYLLRRRKRHRPTAEKPTHLVIAICDHFEPFHEADETGAISRVARWRENFPKMASPFRDSSGSAPKHTFFYPIEQYHRGVLDGIADICGNTGCETEVHLHHEGDSAESLRETLLKGVSNLRQHGLLSKDPDGRVSFGFIHGDWALDNSHPTGRHCGVSNELCVLRESGCYGDFTLPSAPNPTQTRTINSIYYAQGGPDPKSHNVGTPASRSTSGLRGSLDHLLLVQGPLGLNWRWRKAGLLPRLENGDLTGANPPTPSRLRLWLDLGIHVHGHESIIFAKLHTHGAIARNADALLGEPMVRFHRHLASRAATDSSFRFHYVTAREMVNLVHFLEDSDPNGIPQISPAAINYRFRID